MAMVVGNPLDTREYSLDFSTTPAGVTAGTPFAITLRVRQGGDDVVTKFEEVHDKRYHLFIISRDMSVFEHVHPVQQADGASGFQRVCRSPATTASSPTSADRWFAASHQPMVDYR